MNILEIMSSSTVPAKKAQTTNQPVLKASVEVKNWNPKFPACAQDSVEKQTELYKYTKPVLLVNCSGLDLLDQGSEDDKKKRKEKRNW